MGGFQYPGKPDKTMAGIEQGSALVNHSWIITDHRQSRGYEEGP